MKSQVIKMGGGIKRQCSACSKGYQRCNKERRWFMGGGRWILLIVSICTKCSITENERRLREYTPAWLSLQRAQQHAASNGSDYYRNRRHRLAVV